MAPLALRYSEPNYTFGLIADGVSDAIAPRSFSGPRTTRKAPALLRYPSPACSRDVGITVQLSNFWTHRLEPV